MKTIITILISVILSVLLSFILINNKEVDNNDFIEFKDIGQIALDDEDKLKLQTFFGKDLEILGSNVIINAGHESIELRVGNSNKIIIGRNRIDILTDNLYINNNKY